MLANVSHDLRSPLGSILGYTEMLQVGVYGSLADRQQEATSEIIDSTGQLLNFVNNLLNQAQIEAGRLQGMAQITPEHRIAAMPGHGPPNRLAVCPGPRAPARSSRR